MHEYSFHTVWQLPADPASCWRELIVLRSWQQWWPAFQLATPAADREPALGEELRLTVRSPLGYKLKVRLEITEILPPTRLGVAGNGDLAGVGSAVFESATFDDVGTDSQAATTISIDWRVSTTKLWMNMLAPIAAPAFAWAHRKVMADGERRFQNYLRR